MTPLVRRARGPRLGVPPPSGADDPCADSGTGLLIYTPDLHHTLHSDRRIYRSGPNGTFALPFRGCMNGSMEGEGRAAKELRIMLVSAMSAALAPAVLTGLLIIRKLKPRVRFVFRHWNGRLQREIARWS